MRQWGTLLAHQVDLGVPMFNDELDTKTQNLAALVGQSHNICFFTGAGISTESGIPDFRSPGGIWSRYKIIELQDFLSREDARLEDWRRRFHMAEVFANAEPNAAHFWIAVLVADGKARGVITQNIDGLHSLAGVPADGLVEFHGTGAHAHCLECRARYEIEEMEQTIARTGCAPRCDCGGYIKAAVISFGETVPEATLARAVDMVEAADLMVAIGSSLQVWPAAGLLNHAISRDVPLAIINRDPTPFDDAAKIVLRTSVAELAEKIQLS